MTSGHKKTINHKLLLKVLVRWCSRVVWCLVKTKEFENRSLLSGVFSKNICLNWILSSSERQLFFFFLHFSQYLKELAFFFLEN